MTDAVAATPVPVLSFPAILRNSGLKDRFAHLHQLPPSNTGGDSNQSPLKTFRSDQHEGKRWARRNDNAHFIGNPHVVAATRKDYILPVPSTKATFPEPLPSYLPRTVKAPAAISPTRDLASASAGRFSLSLKGMRKELRRAGGRAEALVRDVEKEMVDWLQGGVILRPDESNAAGLFGLQYKPGEGTEIGTTGSIFEVSRTPLQLVWSVADDAFARYVVHCCARYHEIVSFSKGDSNQRLTYLLRPNIKQPDYRIASTLLTPPATDIDYSSLPETTDIDSDFVSDRDLVDSDVEASIDPESHATGNLEVIRETSLPSSPLIEARSISKEEDEWSVLSADIEADESNSEAGNSDLIDSIASLDLEGSSDSQAEGVRGLGDDDPDKTLTQDFITNAVNDLIRDERESSTRIPHHRQPLRAINRRWNRNSSLPSRSPARIRRLASAKKRRRANAKNIEGSSRYVSFYDYLFS
ncbi:hypothetical protein AGABI2DRAFT_185048 [Agaricus bisporus var. bisporus H97]|uniref:hypothetical protein n=1 Tax=Agaricus bisporus var. bisporus (strain H97 / ATCC MYA-4626 / FGSC 10389) TaxID=936046 RepID=UPI00029F55AF|nr:hypothetical protein AGABI2DRAFT_185048 [Agaricus bisporus var. bisporus H97]EKV47039.1 hypothetical protein AGABI2DRAFT_185048 [Agaricus bisporus var. bisporus H97]